MCSHAVPPKARQTKISYVIRASLRVDRSPVASRHRGRARTTLAVSRGDQPLGLGWAPMTRQTLAVTPVSRSASPKRRGGFAWLDVVGREHSGADRMFMYCIDYEHILSIFQARRRHCARVQCVTRRTSMVPRSRPRAHHRLGEGETARPGCVDPCAQPPVAAAPDARRRAPAEALAERRFDARRASGERDVPRVAGETGAFRKCGRPRRLER